MSFFTNDVHSGTWAIPFCNHLISSFHHYLLDAFFTSSRFVFRGNRTL